MLKKLFRRGKNRKPKRTTFWKMFAKAMIIPIIVIIVLANYSYTFIKINAIQEAELAVNEIQPAFETRKLNGNSTGKITDSVWLSMFGAVDTTPLGGVADPATWVEPKSKSITFSFDSEGNIIDSSSAKFVLAIRWNGEKDGALFYSCDPAEYDISELNKVYNDVLAKTDNHTTCETMITSLYLNKAERKMIPHTMTVRLVKVSYGFFDLAFFSSEDGETVEEYDVQIDADIEGYELVELNSTNSYGDSVDYPCGSIQGLYGTKPDDFDELYEKCRDDVSEFVKSGYSGSIRSDGVPPYFNCYDTCVIKRLYTDDGTEGVCSYVVNDLSGLGVWRRLIFVLALLFGIMTLIAFLLCWRRNVKNKAQYAFEDYQRSLINNLAHDLKTPLAVIGGYAENLLELRKESGSEKELKYLSSIMNNVSYTDDIIAKTLQLSENEQIKKLNKTKVDIKALVERLTEKYTAALEERNITLQTELSGEVTADEDLLAAAVENLISNAVKYTRDDGTVTITADKKRLCIVNDVAENVDTKDLLMPFVKGDKSRSDKRSHGLGLAIASAAAERSGFSLSVSCKGKEFTAELTF